MKLRRCQGSRAKLNGGGGRNIRVRNLGAEKWQQKWEHQRQAHLIMWLYVLYSFAILLFRILKYEREVFLAAFWSNTNRSNKFALFVTVILQQQKIREKIDKYPSISFSNII